jgi:hypothetical protein
MVGGSYSEYRVTRMVAATPQDSNDTLREITTIGLPVSGEIQ